MTIGIILSNSNMKKTSKKVAALTACGLIAALGVSASVAYLTDGETTTNTFTVGKVTVDLSEPDYTPEDDVPRVPLEEIAKDPTIANTGNNDMIAFMSFDIPMANVKLAEDDGTAQADASYQELFDFRADSGKYDSVNTGWVKISNTEVDENGDGNPEKMTYLYGYQNVVKAAVDAKAAVGNPGEDGYVAAVDAVEATVVPSIFDHIRLANLIEGQIDEEQLEVPVRAYAIQADFLQNDADGTTNVNIDVEGDMSAETLTQIFELYATQNETVDDNGAMAAWTGINSTGEKLAGSGNELDLVGEEH